MGPDIEANQKLEEITVNLKSLASEARRDIKTSQADWVRDAGCCRRHSRQANQAMQSALRTPGANKLAQLAL